MKGMTLIWSNSLTTAGEAWVLSDMTFLWFNSLMTTRYHLIAVHFHSAKCNGKQTHAEGEIFF